MSAIDEQQHTRDDAQQRDGNAAIGYAEAEQRQHVGSQDPHPEQEHPLRAVHTLSVGLRPGSRRMPHATASLRFHPPGGSTTSATSTVLVTPPPSASSVR